MSPVAVRRSAAVGPIAFALALIVCTLLLVARGHQDADERSAALINALVLVVNSGLLAGSYILAGIGLGRPAAWALQRLPGIRDANPSVGPIWIQSGVGIAATLFLSHLIGMLGLLSGPAGLWVAWGVVAVGLVLLADQVVRGSLRPERWHPLPLAAVIAAPALAVLLAAACSPPGALWLGARSEGGGYDVLSYHLQLPKEWIVQGARLWPVEHNVYSFLPSYVEAAFLHLGAMSRGGLPGGGSFIVGSGLGATAAQFFHAALGVFTAIFVARLAAVRISERSYGDPTVPGVIAGASVLGAPWVVVVGSLAYNDLGVTAMLAAALLVSAERAWSAAARGAGVGLLIGIACSVKPTALLMAAPVAGLFLLFDRPIPTRDRLISTLSGSLMGVAVMLPWLARNWIASGNPVFPFAHRVFGLSHWTQEQMDRYAGAHAFRGSLGERISLLFDAHRGIFNEQWAVLFPLGALAITALVIRKFTRRLGLLLLIAVLAQLIAWLFFTHLQSRFLLPLIVPLALAIGVASHELIRWVSARTTGRAEAPALRRLAIVVAALVPLSLTAWSWLIFIGQRAGRPNQLLALGGIEFLTGDALATTVAEASPAQRERMLRDFPPALYINYTLEPDEAVYFLGGAAPLFFFPAGGVDSIVYHTTWDRCPIGEAMRAHPDDPRAWTAAVRDARRGPPIKYALVDFDELSRLTHRDEHKQSWFDPGVTPERLQRWLDEECELVRSWRPFADSAGIALYRLKDAPVGGMQ